MAVYLTVQGNTAPAIELSLRRKRTRLPIDLTNASSVTFVIQNLKTKTVTNLGHEACTIIDAANGVIVYEAEETDFPSHRTDYLAEVKVTYSDATKEIIYDQLKIAVRPPIPLVS